MDQLSSLSTDPPVHTRPTMLGNSINELTMRTIPDAARELIVEFLCYNGYKNTAISLMKTLSVEPDEHISRLLETADDRMRIMEMIAAGDPLRAIEETQKLYPDVLESSKDALFMLQSQYYLELVRKGQWEEALEFAHDKLATTGPSTPQLKRLMSLLAYDSVYDAPAARELLGKSRNDAVASAVNHAIVNNTHVGLDGVLRHLSASVEALGDELKIGGHWKLSQMEQIAGIPEPKLADHKGIESFFTAFLTRYSDGHDPPPPVPHTPPPIDPPGEDFFLDEEYEEEDEEELGLQDEDDDYLL